MSVREADTLKILRLLVHEVDDEGEAAVKMIVKNSTVFHDRDHDRVEEIPHALARALLVVN